MRIVLITISLFVILGVAYINNISRFSNLRGESLQEVINSKEEVLSQESVKEEPKVTKTVNKDSYKYIEPSSVPTATPQSTSNLADFVYPGSEVISTSANELNLKSSDDPDKIGEWYKNKLKVSGTSVSYASANANGQISIKISSTGGSNINVEIKKEASDSFAYITVKN